MTRRPVARRPRVAPSHAFLAVLVVYFALPLWWLVVASTKSSAGLFNSPLGALLPGGGFRLGDNLAGLFTYSGGLFWRWMGNSLVYALVGGAGATVLAVLAGYGFAKYRFRGSGIGFSILLGSVMVPATALVIPTFTLISQVGLLNTPWGVILPSLLNPFGAYLMRVYAQDAVADEILDAARVDGAGELRTFATVAVPLLRPAIVTVFLLATVGTWNNYFLPLVVLSDPKLQPVTVGLGSWLAQSTVGAGGQPLWNLVITGVLVSLVPLIVAFLSLQRYWRGGLSLGGLK
jgi:multiple sugar transport system permease protein